MFFAGLVLALVSALAVNWAYAKEHDAASQLPPLSLREPVRSVRLLLGARAWLTAFVVECIGWGIYVVALRLSALALVQAVSAAGIGVLAVVSCHGMVHRLSLRSRVAVLIAFAGLVLLALSLQGHHQADRSPDAIGVVLWIGGSAAAALVAATAGRGVAAARFGLAAGLLFAGGDMSAKVIGYGGAWFAVVVALIVCYGLGTSTLQLAFQRGDALTAAGIAELTTNAVPIVAGFVLFGEELPPGARGGLQALAFAAIVVSAALLGRGSRSPAEPSPAPRRADGDAAEMIRA
jgi:hypothetical protein